MEETISASDRIAAIFSRSREEVTKVDAATRLAHYRHKDILAHQGDLGAKLWIVISDIVVQNRISVLEIPFARMTAML